MTLELDRAPRSDHGTSLHRRKPRGGSVDLVTDNAGAIGRARTALASRAVETFAFWNGEEDEAIQGRVVDIIEGPPFRFIVRAEEAI